jgi:hypothetical protein
LACQWVIQSSRKIQSNPLNEPPIVKICFQIYGDSMNEVQKIKTRSLDNWG